MKTQVSNMQSSRGNDVPNQFILVTEKGTFFQSYNSIIARKDANGITLDEKYWDYSTTTGKYRNQFLGETKKETAAKIADGTHKLENLN